MLKRLFFLLLPLLLISCLTQPPRNNSRAPSWVTDVYSAFPQAEYVAATGFGDSRAAAEANALAALTAFFGQSIQVERTAFSSYEQAVVNGIMNNWTDTAQMSSNIKTLASMDNLMGAEIKEVWFDSRGTYYAAAVMNKANGIRIYNELLKNNEKIIHDLAAQSSADPVSFKSIVCLLFAAVLADTNEVYKNIVTLLDGAVNVDPLVIGGLYYRVAANDRIKRTGIGVRITSGDRNGRIFGAFAKCFADWGFEPFLIPAPEGVGTRYLLDVNIVLSPVTLPANPNNFSRIEISAELMDTANNNVILIPFNFNSREGHVSQTEADNRAIAAAERNIGEAFALRLEDYLTKLITDR
ncbi:MAG: LPP20 family lipoprotein [Treponema sp.]|nr:LPP20 family lipoprotein [Treponema sp.]